jgi:hypothetical protein
MDEAVVATVERRRARWPVGLAIVLMVAAILPSLRQASIVIDGLRYYYLDDDQMISMRYARNLVDGMGLVWNPGDRLEGYTNLGWVFVMAGVHALHVPENLTSLVVELINVALAAMILILADRLLARLADPPDWLRATTLLTLGLSVDLLYWAANGFETTLLTAVFLWALLWALDDGQRGEFSGSTCLLAGLLPVIRSDAVHLTAAVACTALLLGSRRRWWALALCGLPLVAHLAFRVSYYGDWLPNTYYLKVAGQQGLAYAGLGSFKGFVAAYPAVIVLAASAAIAPGTRRVRALLASSLLVIPYVTVVGVDMFQHYRFFAPFLPVWIVAAATAICAIVDRRAARIIAAVLAVTTVMVSGVSGRSSMRLLTDNGVMQQCAVAGWLINRYTKPDATILVSAAGSAGYFSHRTAIDMLGKVDREIGHMKPLPEGYIGHNHYDVDRSLARSPDIVMSIVPAIRATYAMGFRGAKQPGDIGFADALLTNRVFIARYLPHPVPLPYLLEWNGLYVREDSPEVAGIGNWRQPALN